MRAACHPGCVCGPCLAPSATGDAASAVLHAEAERIAAALVLSVQLGLAMGTTPERVRSYLGSIRTLLLTPSLEN